MMWPRRAGGVGFLLCLLLAGLPGPAGAVTVGPGGSIQSAINQVVIGALPNGTVIDVQPGTYFEALLIHQTAKSMTIRAAGGAGSVIVDANGRGTSAIRIISASGNIQIDGLKFTRGQGDPSGGNGGGFTIQDASPTFYDCTFENNVSLANGGGGVFTRSNASFDNCVFQNNAALRFGGGMVITTGSRPNFTGCTIQGNRSGTQSAIGSGGGVHANDASPTFRSSVIRNNTASFAGGGILMIGLFGSPNGPAQLTLEDSDVSGNTAKRFSAGDNPAEGGGIHVDDNTIATITRSRIANNVSNTGGGINGYRARINISSSVIQGNSATDAPSSPIVGGFGGGIQASSNNLSLPLRPGSAISMTDTVVRNNVARIGGGVFIAGDIVCAGGSCTDFNATKASLTVTDSIVDSNTATFQASGIFSTRSVMNVSGTLVSRNRNTGGGSGGFGGGFMLVSGTAATISSTRIAQNSGAGFGGGVFMDLNTSVNMSQSTIYKNTATTGGGIFVGSQGNAGQVQDTLIVDNAGIAIAEQCPPSGKYLTYANNTIVTSGTSTIYNGICNPPGTQTISGMSGNNASLTLAKVRANAFFGGMPSSALTVPFVGVPSVLAWSVVRRTGNVTIDQGVGSYAADVGTVDVTPPATRTYTVNANTSAGGGGAVGPLTTTISEPPVRFGAPGDLPVPRDYDGDGKDDLAVYRPATGEWFIFGSATRFQTRVFGAPASSGAGDTSVPADFDGDNVADLAIYRQATGEWFIFGSATGFQTRVFGAAAASGLGDTPVPADYDGDGAADLAIYRRATGEWFIFGSATGFQTRLFGSSSASGLGDLPVPADYDGDGRADLAVRRTSNGTWLVLRSSRGFLQQVWGAPTDLPAPGNFDGDTKTNITVWRSTSGAWLVLP